MPQIIFKGNIENSNTINYFDNNDINLIGIENINNDFNPNTDYIEYIIYDIADNLLFTEYNYNSYKLPSQNYNLNNSQFQTIEIDPLSDLQQYFEVGEFKTQYNFFKQWISNPNDLELYIKDISSDRTELKISSIKLTNFNELCQNLLNDKNSVQYLKPYLLNFGNNNLKLITNLYWDGDDLFIKLYKPLENNIDKLESLCIVEEISKSTIFTLLLESELIPDVLPKLKGPNFHIELDVNNTISTQYESNNSLLSNYSGSNINTILNHLNLAEIEINIDYTNYTNFVRFSSIESRYNNFYDKVKQIEDYNNFITLNSSSLNPNINLSINQYQNNIQDIVSKFDGFENYLYFQSGSYTWPKSNNNLPYILESTGSNNVISWFSSSIDNAIYYDNNNYNKLTNAIPEYILIDSNNNPYINFINMIGHYIDNIWIYIKSITDFYKSNNNLNEGISKDLVFFALQDLGVKLYNNEEDENLYNYIIGNNNIPSQQLVAELYKRIYHNIPLLFKGKGSTKTIQELITVFGLTGSILNVKEYGGNTNTEASLLDYNKNKVKIIDNTIYSASYGSILHPHLKLAVNEYENYKNDDSRIDVAFSPQTQLDLIISSSISSSFNIDEYLGTPDYTITGSYNDLNLIRNTAINLNFTSSYDIRGFIELCKYFDNTLFKMIGDYVPAKSNLSTGIIIKQQALERTKWKLTSPNVENINNNEISFNTASFNSEYNNYFYWLNNTENYYNGELPGTSYDIYNTNFIPNNINPQILSSSLNISEFEHSDFNTLLNNISLNRLSNIRKRIEIQPFSTKSLLLPIELQDSNYSDTSFNNSRYNGVKQISAKYNEYTNGDIAFGKTSCIDYLDSCIYEIEWGASGYPENSRGGGFRLGNIYIIGETKDDIKIIYPNDAEYYNIIEKNITKLNKIIQKSYSGNKLSSGVELLVDYSTLEIPTAKYIVPSNDVMLGVSLPSPVRYARFYTSSLSLNKPYIEFNSGVTHISSTKINDSGNLCSNSYINLQPIPNLITEISSSLNINEKWFVSLYSGSYSGIVPNVSLTTGIDTNGIGNIPIKQYGYPYEVDNIFMSASKLHITLKSGSWKYDDVKDHFSNMEQPLPIGANYPSSSTDLGNFSTGLLISKASYPSNNLTFLNYNPSGTGRSYIILPNIKPLVKSEMDYILKKYNVNPI